MSIRSVSSLFQPISGFSSHSYRQPSLAFSVRIFDPTSRSISTIDTTDSYPRRRKIVDLVAEIGIRRVHAIAHLPCVSQFLRISVKLVSTVGCNRRNCIARKCFPRHSYSDHFEKREPQSYRRPSPDAPSTTLNHPTAETSMR